MFAYLYIPFFDFYMKIYTDILGTQLIHIETLLFMTISRNYVLKHFKVIFSQLIFFCRKLDYFLHHISIYLMRHSNSVQY